MRRDRTIGVILHHSGGVTPDISDGQNLTKLARDPDHLRQRGIMSKAEYHIVIGRNGTVSYPADNLDDALGHCGNNTENMRTVAICFEGNMSEQKLTEAQFNSGVATVARIFRRYGLDVDSTEHYESIRGHNDIIQTECPGKYFPMKSFKNAVKAYMNYIPKRICFTLGIPRVKVLWDYPEAKPDVLIIAKEPFLSGMYAWITKESALALHFNPYGLLNKNDNVKIRDLAIKYRYLISWSPLTKEITLRR